TGGLLRSLLVLALSDQTHVVGRAPSILAFAERIGLGSVVYWAVERTFFAQFCGGSTADQAAAMAMQLAQNGIGCILDLSVEADNSGDASPTVDGWKPKIENTFQRYSQSILATSSVPGGFIAIKLTGLVRPRVLRMVADTVDTPSLTASEVVDKATGG